MILKRKPRKFLCIGLLICYIFLSSTISPYAKNFFSTQTNIFKMQDKIEISKIETNNTNNANIINGIALDEKDKVSIETLQNGNTQDEKSEKIIVKFKDASKADKIRNDVKSKLKINKLDLKRKINKTNFEVLEVNEADLDTVVVELKSNSEVVYAQPDYLLSIDSLPQDERFNEQWGLANSGQTVNGQVGTSGIDVKATSAWDINNYGENIIVGVLDTGIDVNHTDLNSNIYINSNEIPNDGIDNDNNGYVDDVNGFDFANDDNIVYDSAIDDKHGTHIAGIIAAKANNVGIVGVAPNVKVLPLKFISGTTGYTSDAIEAIEYAKNMGIKIINCSFGSTYNNPALLDVMQNSNILFTCAAGNSGVNLDNTPMYPACFNLPNIISVGAIDNKGNLASFSNYGSKVNLVAPGKDILSTVPNNGYEYMSGTSMATPFVTASAAIVLKSDGQLPNTQIKSKLCTTVTSLTNSNIYGLINIGNALGIVSDEPTPQPSETPNTEGDSEKIQPEFNIVEKDIQFAEYRDKLQALEEYATNNNNIDLAKEIEEKLNNLIVQENKLRELPDGYVVASKDEAELMAIQSQINSYYFANASEFLSLEKDYQQLINEYVNIIEGNSVSNTMAQILNINTSVDNTYSAGVSNVYEFTAPNSCQYIFRTGPYGGNGSPNDTVLEIYSDSALTNRVAYDDDSAGNLFSSISIFMNKNQKYYVKLSPYKATGSVYARLSVIYDEAYFTNIALNSPVDVSLSTGEFKVFKFIPTSTTTYDVFTGPYGGTGGTNDTYLEIYSDSALTNRVAYDDDSAGNLFSIIKSTLNTGTKYYIKLRHYSTSGSVNARLTVIPNNPNLAQVINLNSPVNVSLSTGQYKVFKFTPTTNGTYNIFTGPYGGTGSSNDTYLELYTDATLTNKISYDDDSAGNLFSKIQTSLSTGVGYYIKLKPFRSSGNLYTRFNITKEIPIIPINLNQTLDLQVAQSEYVICKFTPTVTGEYKLFTTPNASASSSNDTYLRLYSNQELTNMLSYDDDSGEGLYSLIQYKLIAGTTYYIKFSGYSDRSASGNFTINLLPDTTAPTAPTNLMSSNTTISTTTLSWTASTDNVGVVGYDIYKDGVYLATTTNTTYQATGLTPATQYHFTVKAKDAAGNLSASSNELTVTTLTQTQITATITYDAATKTVSTNGTNSNGTNKQVTILVKDPTGTIKYIDQIASGTNGTFTFLFIINPTVTGSYSVLIGGEGINTPFTDYFTINSLSLLDTTAPTAPTNLVSSNITGTTVDLSWTASTDNVGVVGYDIYKGGAYLATTTTTNYQAIGLISGSTYTFTVKAKDNAGNISGASNIVTAKTVDNILPTTPILAVPNPESTTGTTINLNWTVSTDNVGLTGYDIYKNGTYFTTVATNSYKVTDLIASTSYKFKIIAKDISGNVSNESNEITVTPILVNAITATVRYNQYKKEVTVTGSSSVGQNKQVTILVKDPTGAIKYIDQTTSGANGTFSFLFIVNPTATGSYSVLIGGEGINTPLAKTFFISNLSPVDTTPPTAPTNLRVTATTGTTITISWSASTDYVGVVGYDVYKDGLLLATTTNTNYQATDLLSTESYKFSIKAKDAIGNTSASSNEITVKTTDIVAPTEPTSVSASNITETTVDLRWTAPADNVRIVGYDIYKDGAYLATTANTTYQVTGLTSATEYHFTVKAKDAAGNISDASNEVIVVTLDIIPPTAPTNLVSSNITGTTVDLSWTASTDNVGVVGYDIYKDGAYLATTTNTTYQVTGLTSATTYKFTVKAKDAAGNISDASNEVIVVTIDILPPTAPTNLVSSNITGTTADLSWTASTDNVGVVGYDIYKDGVYLATTENTAYQVTGLTSATTYKFTVKAKDAAGNISNASNEVVVTTLDITPPTAPTNLTASNITETTADLSWTASTDNVGVVGYDIYKDGAYLATTENTAYQVTGLTFNTQYNFTVKAKDAAGNISDASNEVIVVTLDVTPPTAPVVLTPSNITGTTADLSWDASTDNVGVVGYDIYKDGAYLATTTNTTYQVTGLTSATTYKFTVKAKDSAGNISDASNEVIVVTIDILPPTAPTNLVSSNITGTTADLSWTASTDNVGVVGYDIYKDGVYLATTENTAYQVTGLTVNTQYKFTVKAKDAAGNISDASNEVIVVTLDILPPLAPTNLVSSNITGTTADLSWNASTDNVGVVGYDIYKDGAYLATTTNTTYQVTGLTSATEYKFTVKAKDAAGNISVASNEVIVIPPTEKITANLTVTNNTIIVSGITSIGTNKQVTILVTSSNSSIVYIDQKASGTNGAYNFTFKMPSSAQSGIYTVKVGGEGISVPISQAFEYVKTTTVDPVVPTEPTNLEASNITGTTVDLKWDASVDSTVVGYGIYRNGSNIATVVGVTYTDTLLTEGTTYTYYVVARNVANDTSKASNVISVTTHDATLPATPTELVASNITETSVHLSWTTSVSTDTVKYYVYLGDEKIAETSDLYYDITALTKNTTYTFKVSAIDSSNNESINNPSIQVLTINQNKLTISCYYNKVFDIAITDNDFNNKQYEITFNSQELEVIDLCSQTFRLDKANIVIDQIIKGTNIIIKEFTDGKIVFINNSNETTNGIVNTIRFKCKKVSENTEIFICN